MANAPELTFENAPMTGVRFTVIARKDGVEVGRGHSYDSYEDAIQGYRNLEAALRGEAMMMDAILGSLFGPSVTKALNAN